MSTSPGLSKAQEQPGVGASARTSALPELKPGRQPELEVFAPEAEGLEGSKEARSVGKEVYKEERSGSG
jgi:hypothetical protein